MAVADQVQAPTPVVERPRLARLAVGTIFFVNGALIANWFARTPDVKQQLGLSEGTFSLALLAMAVGALMAQPITGWAIGRVGSRVLTTVMALLFCGVFALIAFATSLPMLVPILFVVGICNASLDVAMNSQAAIVEGAYGRSIMNSFHGLWSLGGLGGAALSALVVSNGVEVMPHFLIAAAVAAVIMLIAVRGLVPDGPAPGHEVAFALPSRALIPMGIVAFCALVSEGAIGDWGAIYLHEGLGSTEALAAAGYAVFALTMAAGRFTGDWLTTRLGAGSIVRGGGALVVAGILLVIMTSSTWPAIAGFALVGAGVSCIFPLIMSAAGRAPGMAPGTAIAAMATVGYSGFLIGPPLIGWAAEVFSLRGALGIIAIFGVLIVLLGGAVAGRPRV